MCWFSQPNGTQKYDIWITFEGFNFLFLDHFFQDGQNFDNVSNKLQTMFNNLFLETLLALLLSEF